MPKSKYINDILQQVSKAEKQGIYEFGVFGIRVKDVKKEHLENETTEDLRTIKKEFEKLFNKKIQTQVEYNGWSNGWGTL